MAGSYQNDRQFPAKCRECICGIENGRGIWCARLKKIPNEREVRRCRHFCPRAILERVGYDVEDDSQPDSPGKGGVV
jgi:hypothetical protein